MISVEEYRQRIAPQRLESETVPLTIEVPSTNDKGEAFIATHDLAVSLAYGPNGRLREIVFVSRGRIGHGLDPLFHDLGIKLSRAIQGRNPDTGEV